MDQEIMLPNSVTMNSRAMAPMNRPPDRPVIRIIASMSPEEELISWVGMAAPMPKAADQIDGCNDQSADDNGLRDLLFRIAHIVGEGADHLKPQHVEYNDGDKGQTFQIEAGQKAGGRHIVCKAVLDAEVNPHHTYQQSENDLDDSADIQNKDVVADRETGDQRDDQTKAS